MRVLFAGAEGAEERDHAAARLDGSDYQNQTRHAECPGQKSRKQACSRRSRRPVRSRSREKARESIRDKLRRKTSWTPPTGITGNAGNVRGGSLRTKKHDDGVMRHLIFCGNQVSFSLSGGEKIECI